MVNVCYENRLVKSLPSIGKAQHGYRLLSSILPFFPFFRSSSLSSTRLSLSLHLSLSVGMPSRYTSLVCLGRKVHEIHQILPCTEVFSVRST